MSVWRSRNSQMNCCALKNLCMLTKKQSDAHKIWFLETVGTVKIKRSVQLKNQD